MILVTGGAFQGKTDYVRRQIGCAVTDGTKCTFDDARHAPCIKNYQVLVRRLAESGIDPIAFTKTLCAENPACTVILDEIGCGIIPLEKGERIWREQVGQCGCILAEHADAVVRLVCGIPTTLKGDLP